MTVVPAAPPADRPATPGWGGERRQNHLYQPFLRGAVATVLTVGCSLGALNLLVMGFGANLDAVWTPLIQAHGYSQIFGWVGLFLMGMAYHTMTRYWLRPLRHPGWVAPSFVLVVASLVLRVLTQPFAALPVAGVGLVLSGVLGLAGYGLFAWAMFDTMRHGADSTAPGGYVPFMVAGFAWLVIAAALTLAITTALALEGADTIPAAWDAPYLRVALSGALVTLILGYTLRIVPFMLGLRPGAPRAFRQAFVVYTAGVVGQVVAAVGLSGEANLLLSLIGAVAELAGLAWFVGLIGLFARPQRDRPVRREKNPWPARFIRSAYGWLLAAATLNAVYAVVAASGGPVPHAFVAAYHHALTVGFISFMIVGMSMRLVPVFLGDMLRRPGWSALIFAGLFTGNGLRVLTEPLAARFGGAFYLVMGLSGVIEVAALACYGVLLWRALGRPSYGASRPEAAAPIVTPR